MAGRAGAVRQSRPFYGGLPAGSSTVEEEQWKETQRIKAWSNKQFGMPITAGQSSLFIVLKMAFVPAETPNVNQPENTL